VHFQILSFDLDGTLVDTATEIAEAANRMLDSFSIGRRGLAQITQHVGLGTPELLRGLLDRIAAEEPGRAAGIRRGDAMERLSHHYADTAGTIGAAYPETREALTRLREAGVRLACVTNKELRYARKVLVKTGLDEFFALTIGGDSLAHKKPHASVLRHVIDTLRGEPARTAHVGDSRTDIEAARNAGVAAWAVPYGYNAGIPIAAANPERIFASLLDVAIHVTDGNLA